MATQRLFQNLGIRVTAATVVSPYALQAFCRYAVLRQRQPAGSLLMAKHAGQDSYQRSYGIFSARPTISTNKPATPRLPTACCQSSTPIGTILQQGLLPQFALFFRHVATCAERRSQPAEPAEFGSPANSPLALLGFGSGNLINNQLPGSATSLDALASPDGAVPSYTTSQPANRRTHCARY